MSGAATINSHRVVDLLRSLVDRSLVVFEPQPDGSARYRLLETTRQYALEKLKESENENALRDQHRNHFLQLAEKADSHLAGPEQGEWLERLEAEHDNLRAALSWSLTVTAGSRRPVALMLCGVLQRFWYTRGHLVEGLAWCQASLASERGQEHSTARAKALNGAGVLAYCQGDYVGARTYFEQSLEIRREIGDRASIAFSLIGLGIVAHSQGDNVGARAYHEQSLEIQREIGDLAGIANSLNNLGNVASDQGDNMGARAYHEQSLEIRREIEDRRGIVASLEGFARLVSSEALTSSVRTGSARSDARMMAGLRRAARLWSAAQVLRAQIGAPPVPTEQENQDRHVAAAKERLGEEVFSNAWAEGAAMALEEAVKYALHDSDVEKAVP